MKLLIYEWTSYFQYDLYQICKEKGIEYQTFTWKFKNKNEDEEFLLWFRKQIDLKKYDALFSVNFYPLLSKVCMENGVPYLSWCYDNPLNVERIEESLPNPVNYVFLYDRVQYEKYAAKGIETVYHLPLGVNAARYASLAISMADKKRFQTEVSFIGQLYESHFQDLLAPLKEYTKGYLQALVNVQAQIYGSFIAGDVITQELVADINSQYAKKRGDTKLIVSKEALLFAIGSEITRRDRLILLSLCGKRYDTRFYSNNDTSLLTDVKKCGPLNYITEMPQMFACSKINLNPSLRMIESGIPQRAFDIMASGGFLLSNYQQELAENYLDGEDLVLYDSYEDAIEKVSFYLKNDDLRVKIAKNGQKKTLEQHRMQDCLDIIFKIAGLN